MRRASCHTAARAGPARLLRSRLVSGSQSSVTVVLWPDTIVTGSDLRTFLRLLSSTSSTYGPGVRFSIGALLPATNEIGRPSTTTPPTLLAGLTALRRRP